jgi:regulator of nucleoside diphosphate kinase
VLPLPAIRLASSDYRRLEKLARSAAQHGDMDGMSLLAQINRAEIVPDDYPGLESIVTVGSWVTYLTNWSVARKTVQLVYPEDYTFDLAQISVLSGLGAALLGLRIGDQMPYFLAGCVNIVRVQKIAKSVPRVVPLSGGQSPLVNSSIIDGSGPQAA